MTRRPSGVNPLWLAGLGLALVWSIEILPSGAAGNQYDEVEQTVHNILPPSGSFTLKDLCLSCHVDGQIYIPGMPVPQEEASLPIFPVFGGSEEQKPAWARDTIIKSYDIPQSWPLPKHLSPDLPFGASADCLGCHDGAIAADVHSGNERKDTEGRSVLTTIFDRFEEKLGTNPIRKSAIPDHPISIVYPIEPNGAQVHERPVSSLTRFFPIPDLQDDQLVLPSASASKFYARTPGNPSSPSEPGEGGVSSTTRAAAREFAADPAEQFRLIHTTFGVIHCDSCHNAHSELHAGFLRDTSPELCLVCHDR